jgi:hypothetical protein
MIARLDQPVNRCHSGHPRETEVLFPFRNPGLKVLGQVGVPRKDDSDTQFTFKALPTRRQPSGNDLEMTSYLQAPLGEAYSHWTKSDHLPHFMRAVAGTFDADSSAHTWSLQLRDEDVPWEAVTIERIPFKRISWWSPGSGSHRNRGFVSFDAVGKRVIKLTLNIEFYETHARAVTAGTMKALRSALDRGLDVLHSEMISEPSLGPACADL